MHRLPPEEQFPIIADTERPATPLRVLKYNDTFSVFNHNGDIRTGEAGEEGIYHEGTRFLSRFELSLFGGRPLLLSSTISGDNARFDADLPTSMCGRATTSRSRAGRSTCRDRACSGTPAASNASACRTLFDEPMFSGWGVRTVAVGEARYNPMSYHNGSIWPHDNALVAMGLSRYGYTAAAARIMATMFDLSEVVDLHRLPELICGFPRRGREHPTQYPVACAPQAWAAGAIYMLLGACLGLRIDAPAKRLSFSMGLLPDTIEWLRLSNLVIGDARVDLRLEWHPHDVGLTVLRREGQLDIVAMR